MGTFLYMLGMVVTALGAIVVLSILNPLLYALGGYVFGLVLVVVFPFAGIWVAVGLQKLGFDVQPTDLPMVFAAIAVLAAYFRSSHTTTVKK